MSRFALCGMITLIIGILLPMTLHVPLVYWAITLPGTAMHEGMHWIAAFALQGNPGTFSLIPSFGADGVITLGNITANINWYNAAIIGMAPLFLVFSSAWLLIKAGTRKSMLSSLILCYVSACGFASFMPSSTDWGVAISEPLSFIPAILLFYFVGGFCFRSIESMVRIIPRTRVL